MWILECDGDLFGHKRTWLKPGQKYLFGRTKSEAGPGERAYVISNKSVSRKHLVIFVAHVSPGKGSEIFEKSSVTITDESKLGTHLDGERFINDTRNLTKSEHSIKLGSYSQTFRVSWQPVIFTFSFTDKEQRRVSDILAPFRKKLEPLDIKTILPYVIGGTTHVITSKRNIAKGLQALINAKYIVTEAFIDAVVAACASPGLAEDGSSPLPSPVEEDAEANWPNALDHLPDPGKEPTPRAPELFAPDSARVELFEGFTFIFADATQWDQLSPVVTNGGGKALRYDMKLGQTALEEFVQYVRNVADQKGMKNLDDNDKGKSVVVVRFRGKGDTEQWALDFLEGLDRELGQRSIEQNEFLDAILTKDVRPLRRELLEEEMGESEEPSSTGRMEHPSLPSIRFNHSSGSAKGPQEEASGQPRAENLVESRLQNQDSAKSSLSDQAQPLKSRSRRPVTQSRFKGFDDFDASQLPKREKTTVESPGEEASATATQTDSQPLFISNSQDPPQTRAMASKKRPHPETTREDDGKADMMDKLLPGAAAMKKRRLEDERSGRMQSVSEGSVEPESARQKNTAKKPVKKEIDVRSEARSHAEKLDKERASRHSETKYDSQAQQNVDENEVSGMRNLALVETMDLPTRRTRSHNAEAGDEDDPNPGQDSRWDDRWNGLKNFKGFKRRGERSDAAGNRGPKILIALEEVKRKDFGIGENRLHNSSSGKRDKESRREQIQSETVQERRLRENEENEEVIPEEIAGQPREGPIADALAEQGQSTARDNGKRPASRQNHPPSKRQKQSRLVPQLVDDDSSDEDELKFRFRRKKV